MSNTHAGLQAVRNKGHNVAFVTCFLVSAVPIVLYVFAKELSVSSPWNSLMYGNAIDQTSKLESVDTSA